MARGVGRWGDRQGHQAHRRDHPDERHQGHRGAHRQDRQPHLDRAAGRQSHPGVHLPGLRCAEGSHPGAGRRAKTDATGQLHLVRQAHLGARCSRHRGAGHWSWGRRALANCCANLRAGAESLYRSRKGRGRRVGAAESGDPKQKLVAQGQRLGEPAARLRLPVMRVRKMRRQTLLRVVRWSPVAARVRRPLADEPAPAPADDCS